MLVSHVVRIALARCSLMWMPWAALNFAATLECPVVFFCRNNGYAIRCVFVCARGDKRAAAELIRHAWRTARRCGTSFVVMASLGALMAMAWQACEWTAMTSSQCVRRRRRRVSTPWPTTSPCCLRR